ncbi:polysaccharide biosynthesis protein [Fusibacter tunisiensis]|uniref:FlaA1/EpsC-like NDP-sugar epimerase n=1 Tax=Fusibacter tunisiensis TaxID=1008308 RepID=A0ABS2MN60_9FIRM|nr:nucleoside-diphosphate sugar epimerase/dehydratase [Fusibacter tunisiensis]MBM7560834.1 FlaA1/EpsC-like NDP-sugar epimerase [Fusibacter tunisiensis]
MNKRRVKKIILMLLDIASFYVAMWLAYLIKYDQMKAIPPELTVSLFKVITVIVGLKFVTLLVLKMYSKIWRFAGITELIDVVVACGIGTAVSMGMLFMISRQPEFDHILVPRSILVMAFMMDVAFVGGSRFLYRLFFHVSPKEVRRHQLKKRTLIYGAGQAGVMILKEINTQGHSEFSPIGFMDDDLSKKGQKLHGLSIFGGKEDLIKTAIKEEVEAIIIAMPSASDQERKAVINAAKETGAKVSILPKVYDLIDEASAVSKIRPVEIEDLLGREEVKLDTDMISGYVKNQVVLVTGGGGSIGSELCRQIARYKPSKLVILDIYENNAYDIQMELKRNFPDLNLSVVIASVRDRLRLEKLFQTHKPNVVFHAAAHKHVPLMEASPEEAIKNNVYGTQNVIEVSDQFGVKRFVLISTDKAVNPTNVMGASKRICEMLVQSYASVSRGTEYGAVRFGNVLGSNGSVIPLFKKQIQAGGPVTVTHPDIIRYFMTIPEAARLVVQAGGLAQKGEIFVLDMGEPVKIDTLARDLIRLSGLEPSVDIEIKYTGLRPGEKLYEELLMSEEGLGETEFEKIFIARPMTLPYEELSMKVGELAKYFEDADALVTAMKKVVPTFKTPEEINTAFKEA